MSNLKYLYEGTSPKEFFFLNESIIVDIFGFNYHDFSFIGMYSHLHLEAEIMEESELYVKIVMVPC